ncbi:hypothetical protein MKQ68_18960 [Chitinophaga horti]|uniref:Uncharacterized protein n=1 Tax=Chitinophaga horti TaxID=2920382 RepID=A0ABY6J1D3_9BACT|nr:hypothetical protein [Chitinophaga horti]UYQ92171.1 hypothetical protein MKQ68_18960 [Chitinophaga horti]
MDNNQIAIKINAKKDEHYVLHLCDQVLGFAACRQYNKFEFLKGDPDKKGRCRKLPVDGYYPQLGLVIEYRERQHFEPVAFFDKPGRLTNSGVNRAEQRKIYDERRRLSLPANGIRLLEISYKDFSYNGAKRIVRNLEKDMERVRYLLDSFI